MAPVCLFSMAVSSATRPVMSVALIRAPASTSTTMAPTCPASAARCSAVRLLRPAVAQFESSDKDWFYRKGESNEQNNVCRPRPTFFRLRN